MPNNTHYVINLKSFLPYRLSVLEQQVSRAIARKYSDAFGLSRMQWRVLSTLAQFDRITARAICDFTGMEKMQASRAITGLQAANLLSQAPSSRDQRANVLSLTTMGREVYQQIAPQVLAEEQHIFSALSAQERDTFERLVDKLCASLGS